MKKLLLLLSVLFVVSCSKDPVIYTLTTSANPIEGGAVSPTTKQYEEGETATITATPAAEYLFQSWSGATGSASSTSLVMNSDKSVTANFVKKKYPLTIEIQGQGMVAEKVIKAGAATDYNSGTIVELTATPSDEWEFKEWTGDVAGAENPTQITIDKVKTVTAVFEKNPFYLDDNGVTIKARDWVTVGVKGEIDGVTYTAVDNKSLVDMINNFEDVSKVVTSLVTNMNIKLSAQADFNQDIGSWDTSNVIYMTKLFQSANAFNQDISNWDVSSVTNMEEMFSNATIFNQNIGDWDVSNVTKMTAMFHYANNFNQDLNNWDTSSVIFMDYMFDEAKSFNQNIGDWDVNSVLSMKAMFRGAESFNQNIGNWNPRKCYNFQYMFRDTPNFNQDLSNWCTLRTMDKSGWKYFALNSALINEYHPKWATCPGVEEYNYSVSATSTDYWILSGNDRNGAVDGNNPSLTFNVNDEIFFSNSATGHPFYIKTVQEIGTQNLVKSADIKGNNGYSSFTYVPSHPGTFYYQCSTHVNMSGVITIKP